MPVYLCQPGSGAGEPWRHGIHVYAAPFAMDEATGSGSERDSIVLPEASAHVGQWSSSTQQHPGLQEGDEDFQHQQPHQVTANIAGGHHSPASNTRQQRNGLPIRRVRHSEVVLVDDVCVAFDRYWLRLRWPGRKGGFAGYIALGKVGQESWLQRRDNTPKGMSI